MPLETDAWGVDVGRLRLAEGADDAARASRRRPSPTARWAAARSDLAALLLRLERDAEGAGEASDTPFTPAVSLVVGLDVALGLLLDEGLEAAFERHAASAAPAARA